MSVVLVVALRFGRFIEAFVSSPNSEVLLLKVVGLALLVAGLAQQPQVSAAVGTFLVGIALSGEPAEDAQAPPAPLRDLFAAFGPLAAKLVQPLIEAIAERSRSASLFAWPTGDPRTPSTRRSAPRTGTAWRSRARATGGSCSRTWT